MTTEQEDALFAFFDTLVASNVEREALQEAKAAFGRAEVATEASAPVSEPEAAPEATETVADASAPIEGETETA